MGRSQHQKADEVAVTVTVACGLFIARSYMMGHKDSLYISLNDEIHTDLKGEVILPVECRV